VLQRILNMNFMLPESVYNVDETALTTFYKKTGKAIMQKWNIADLINLKCEERNEYNS
jgi:hypothetical protein